MGLKLPGSVEISEKVTHYDLLPGFLNYNWSTVTTYPFLNCNGCFTRLPLPNLTMSSSRCLIRKVAYPSRAHGFTWGFGIHTTHFFCIFSLILVVCVVFLVLWSVSTVACVSGLSISLSHCLWFFSNILV